MRFGRSVAGGVILGVIAMAGAGAGMAPVDAAPPSQRTTAVIVRLVAGSDASSVAADAKSRGGKVSYTYRNVFTGFAAKLPDQALAALRRNPAVFSIEEDAQVDAVGDQSGATWGLDRIDQAVLPLNGVFSYPDVASSVTAYIVDTGLLGSHAEFTGRVGSGYTAISDGNGTTDCNGHGTHVSGSVGGTTYGVAKTSVIVPVRVLGCDGSGSYSGVIAGLDWIVANHVDGAPAVANMSLGGPANSTLDAAVQRVIDDGVTVVVAAGNSSTDACTSSPARTPAAITVAASDSTDTRASFSNYGTCVDVFAPGVSIRSAWSTSTTATNVISGTSMASPHVAGAVALLLGQDPLLTPAQAGSTVTDQSTVGAISAPGLGTPNRLLRVVAAPAGPPASTPAAPTGVTATPLKRAATVSWTQGADGGAPLTSQTVYVYTALTQVATVVVSGAATSVRVGGLKAGRNYVFKVSATNSVGTSPLSTVSNMVTVLR